MCSVICLFVGHAIGVIEPNVTLRVEDMLGEYMQIRYEGILGWVRYKGNIKTVDTKSTKYCTILVPSYHHIPDFYKRLRIWRVPRYYRFNDNLPISTELKVRLKPDLEASEVVGHITMNMIIECWGLLNGEWLQVRYNKYDCGWVLCQNDVQEQLLIKLPDIIQIRLQNHPTLTKQSPFVLLKTAPELLIEKKKKAIVINPLDSHGSSDMDVHYE